MVPEIDHWIVVQNILDIGFRPKPVYGSNVPTREPYRKLRVDVMVLRLPRDVKYRSGDYNTILDRCIESGNLIEIKDTLIKAAFFEDDPGHGLDAVIRPVGNALGYIEEMKEKYAVLPEHVVVEDEDMTKGFELEDE